MPHWSSCVRELLPPRTFTTELGVEMAKYETDIETELSPEGVVAALTDFSERRAEIWPYLAKDRFEVRELGETSALIKEGSGAPVGVWAVERYDWSEPNTVRWSVVESDAFVSGTTLIVRVAPRDGGGSRVHIVWERAGKTAKGKFVVGLISLAKGKPIFKTYKKVFDKLATS